MSDRHDGAQEPSHAGSLQVTFAASSARPQAQGNAEAGTNAFGSLVFDDATLDSVSAPAAAHSEKDEAPRAASPPPQLGGHAESNRSGGGAKRPPRRLSSRLVREISIRPPRLRGPDEPSERASAPSSELTMPPEAPSPAGSLSSEITTTELSPVRASYNPLSRPATPTTSAGVAASTIQAAWRRYRALSARSFCEFGGEARRLVQRFISGDGFVERAASAAHLVLHFDVNKTVRTPAAKERLRDGSTSGCRTASSVACTSCVPA